MNAGEVSVIITVIGLRRNSQVLYEIVSNTPYPELLPGQPRSGLSVKGCPKNNRGLLTRQSNLVSTMIEPGLVQGHGAV